MADSKAEGTDGASIKPVSSLRSHFENLASLKPPPPSPGLGQVKDESQSPRFPRYGHANESAASLASVSRISLDLPRADSPWRHQEPTPASAHPTSSGARAFFESTRPRSPPKSARQRPISMLSNSPERAPAVTVDSPKSPAPGTVSPRRNRFANSISHLAPSGPPSDSIPARPVRLIPSRAELTAQFTGASEAPSFAPNASQESIIANRRSPSVPPPVNRADKPKIPPKLTPQTLGRAGLAPIKVGNRDEGISPFSTPPGSEGSPSPERQTRSTNGSRTDLHPRTGFQGLNFEPPPLHPYVTQSRLNSDPGHMSPRDAREQGLGRDHFPPRKDSIQPSPNLRQQVAPVRDARELGFAAGRRPSEDARESTPRLPPRRGDTDSGVSMRLGPPAPDIPPRRSMDQSRPIIRSTQIRPNSYVEHDIARSYPPPPARNGYRHNPSPERHVLSPISSIPPPFSRETKHGHAPPPPSRPPARKTDSDDAEVLEYPHDDHPTLARSDFPDASRTNRRPPLLGSRRSEFSTKYDTRVFDVSGRYVCTTGYFTRVVDMTSGDLLMNLSHGETVKVTAMAFKAGTSLDDEGMSLWLGTNSGELHEVDIAAGAVVASRNAHARKEVIKVFRCRKDMWTLDDDGRLLVWPADETGAPNLNYHNHSFRVPKGHTFSIVVGVKLWLATGKEIRVFKPVAGNDAGFQVLQKPMVQPQTGDVTSGALSTKQGRVYFGHVDGKVTVYSIKDYTCVATVNVSVYKINCLAVVGDYLWAAYKTGMIYVYDTRPDPWLVKKDWHAHSDPVVGLVLDPSCVWTMKRLQVASLGADNFIRLWDGTLEEDWLESDMQSRDVDFCTFREITASVMTWNAGASKPGHLPDSDFIRDVVHPEDPPEILVFGFQELVDLENKKITAKSFLKSSKKKDQSQQEHISRQYRVWKEHLQSCLDSMMPVTHSYVLLHAANMVGLFTCVFVKQDERRRIRNVSAAEVKRGMGGLHGNKGALILRFVLDDSSFCLINCHLAAGQSQTMQRNNDIAAILETDALPIEPDRMARTDLYVGGGDGTMILDHEICILNGDLNYRIDSMPRDAVVSAVKSGNLQKLLERDQLLASRRKNPGFRLRAFREGPINFAPTYKYDVGTDTYDTSEKKRSPAWCDRVLYRGVGRIKQVDYRRHDNVKVSDHRPVSALFRARVKTISAGRRVRAWEACQERFREEKRRLAAEASIDYLINTLGIKTEEARALISAEDA